MQAGRSRNRKSAQVSWRARALFLVTVVLLLFEISVEPDDPTLFSIEELLFVDDGRLVTTHGRNQVWTRPTWIDGATLLVEEHARIWALAQHRIFCLDDLGRAAQRVRFGTGSPQGPEHLATCLSTLGISAQHGEEVLAWVAQPPTGQETDEDEPLPRLRDIEVVAIYDFCRA